MERSLSPQSAHRHAQSAPSALDDIGTHEILDGLARLHSLVVVCDMQGRVLWMSEAFGSACGHAKPRVGTHLGHAFAALRGAREQARLREQVSQIHQHLRNHDILHDMRVDLGRHEGVSRSLDLSAFRTSTQDGRPIVVAIIHPSEQSGGAQAALREEDDGLECILESSPHAVLAIDRFGFITYANPAVTRILGLQADKLLDKPVALLQPQSMEFVRLLSDLDSRGSVDEHELCVERPDGTRVRVSVSVRRPSENPRGRYASVVHMRDVTAESSIRRQLEQKNAELEGYVHNVSHDLRTPLVSLLGFTRLLRQDYDHLLDESGRHFTERIEQAGRNMQCLVEDLLELCRIGVVKEHRTLVDPRAVLLQLQAELKLGLDEADATLELPADPPLVMCDRTRLYQIFSNLVGNALQHMGPCEDRVIRVGIETRPDHHLIVVEDKGRGIEPDSLDHIFDPFHSRTAGSGRPSSGLGLAIVRKIVETHGGRIWAESEPDRGARFFVSLPRA